MRFVCSLMTVSAIVWLTALKTHRNSKRILINWANRPGMWVWEFQRMKCNIMQLTRKRIKNINAVYSLKGTVLNNVDNIKYLGVTISKDLKWNTHVSNFCTKANRTLGFLRRSLSPCPQDVKKTAYKGLVRPILEYASPVWDPHGIVV